MRLVKAAQESGRFDAAAVAYVTLLLKDPAGAARFKPRLPDSKSTYLDSAASDVATALSAPDLNDDQRIALLGFMIELQTSRGDARAADAATERLDQILAINPANPAAARAIARRKLQSAQAALDRKAHAAAIRDIELNRSLFTEHAQQADALFILGQAQAGQAGRSKPALRDAALTFMRIVAHFKDEPGQPRVVESLMSTARIFEQLDETTTAADLYAQTAAQYPDHPSAAEARQSATRLKQLK